MVYYMHSFGRTSGLAAEESSSSDSSSSSSSSSDSSLTNQSSSSTLDDVSVDMDGGYQFGKRSSKSKHRQDKFMARLLCAAKLGFLAALMMMLLGYMSVHVMDMQMFRKEDPVSRRKVVDWQKLCLYSGVVFLAVSFGSAMWASSSTSSSD